MSCCNADLGHRCDGVLSREEDPVGEGVPCASCRDSENRWLAEGEWMRRAARAETAYRRIGEHAMAEQVRAAHGVRR